MHFVSWACDKLLLLSEFLKSGGASRNRALFSLPPLFGNKKPCDSPCKEADCVHHAETLVSFLADVRGNSKEIRLKATLGLAPVVLIKPKASAI